MLLSKTLSASNGTSAGRFGLEPGRDDEDVAPQGPLPPPVLPLDGDGVRVEEAAVAPEDLDPVAPERGVDHVQLALDDEPLAVHEVGHRDVVRHLGLEAVEPVARHAEEEEGALAERLRGDRPPVHAGPADDGGPLDEGDALVRLGGLDRGAFAARAAAEDDDVEVGAGGCGCHGADRSKEASGAVRAVAWAREREYRPRRMSDSAVPAADPRPLPPACLPLARAALVQRGDVRQLLRLRRALPGDAAPREGVRLHGRAGRAPRHGLQRRGAPDAHRGGRPDRPDRRGGLGRPLRDHRRRGEHRDRRPPGAPSRQPRGPG